MQIKEGEEEEEEARVEEEAGIEEEEGGGGMEEGWDIFILFLKLNITIIIMYIICMYI